MKLRKCKECKNYTLKDKCLKCNAKVSDAHYKFIKIKSLAEKEEEY